MGVASPTDQKAVLSKFILALEQTNCEELRKIAASELLNDGKLLNLAVEYNAITSLKFLIDSCGKILFYLSALGLNTFCNDERGVTPVEAALETGNLEALKVLVKRGATLTSEEHGKYLIKYAEVNNEEMISYLTGHGVDPNWIDKRGDCALFKAMALRNHRACKVLVQRGASLDISSKMSLSHNYFCSLRRSFGTSDENDDQTSTHSLCSSPARSGLGSYARLLNPKEVKKPKGDTEDSPIELPVESNRKECSIRIQKGISHCGCNFLP